MAGPNQIRQNIEGKLKRHYCKLLDDATEEQVYWSAASCIKDTILDQWLSSNRELENKKFKRLYYLSAEFLMGRSLINNMINLEVYQEYKKALESMGYSLARVEEQENDPASATVDWAGWRPAFSIPSPR